MPVGSAPLCGAGAMAVGGLMPFQLTMKAPPNGMENYQAVPSASEWAPRFLFPQAILGANDGHLIFNQEVVSRELERSLLISPNGHMRIRR
jgi:hypothetical protein